MALHRSSIYTAAIFGTAIAGALAPAAIQNVGSDVDFINGFEFLHSGLHWWSGDGYCRGEFPCTNHIGLLGTIGIPFRMLVSDCLAYIPPQ